MRCTCAKCDVTFDNVTDYQKHICGMEVKMTREEALNKLKNIKTPLSVENIVDILEEVGLLEFEEEKEIVRLCSYDRSDLGVISVEEWPEGLVLWVGDKIRWKSWVNPVPDLIVIEARKYVDDCRMTPYESSQAFKTIGDHFKMLEKLLEYIENKKGT